MGQNQWDRRRTLTPLMDEMDIFRRIPIMLERRKPLDLRLPIETISPVFADLPQKPQVYPVLPVCSRNFIRPPGSPQSITKIIHCGLRERDSEGFDGHICRCIRISALCFANAVPFFLKELTEAVNSPVLRADHCFPNCVKWKFCHIYSTTGRRTLRFDL